MYSPFKNKQGNNIGLDKLAYRNLIQLTDIDEGYKIEFKRAFDESVKKKIPDIITSFANCDGGWLFIGIDDESHLPTFIPKSRTDYSQIISQMLKNKTSPLPTFESKFIRDPDNKKQGVLAIYVSEGRFPPYISNGKIYVRNGSSKEPVTSERSTVEYLYHKATAYKEEIDRFCNRNIHFPYNIKLNGYETIDYPICNVYLKYIGDKTKNIYSYEDQHKFKKYIIKNKDSIFTHAQHSSESIIFMHSAINPSEHIATIVWELCYDLSIKFHIPFIWSNDHTKDQAIQNLKNRGINATKDIKLIDGIQAFDCISACITTFLNTIMHLHCSLKDYILCFEIENGESAVLYFNCDEYYDQIKNEGIPYHSWIKNKSKTINLRNYPNVDRSEFWYAVTYDFMMASFGFDPSQIAALIQSSHYDRFPQLN